jgi:K+-sensing histidine kinase KdpD
MEGSQTSRTRHAALGRAALLDVLSHELRTPLTSIHAAAVILRHRGPTLAEDARDELIEDIRDETERLLRVVDDALMVGQLDAGLGLGREPLLLQRLVPNVLEEERRRRPGIAVELHQRGELPVVCGDELAVRQVVRDLVSDLGRWRAHEPVRVELGVGEGHGAHVRVIQGGTGDAADPRHGAVGHRTRHATHSLAGAIGRHARVRLARAMGGRCWTRWRADGRTEHGLWLPAFVQMADD